MEQLIEQWDGMAVVTHVDRETGAWVFIAMHDATLGAPCGGTRMKVYADRREGLVDALRLAQGMTYKWATVDLPHGGGKAVIALREELEHGARVALLERYAVLLNELKGSFGTGQDLGTTREDMELLARCSRWVHGVDPATGVMRDPGPFTARGVLMGIRAACEARWGSGDLGGRSVLVQGVGDVGLPLAQMVARGGGRIRGSDIDDARARAVASELGGDVVPPAEVYDTECDVYAPCAVGATLNENTIPRLRCAIVAGSANNQLETERDADRLRERAILYAPDYVVNAGGAIAFGGTGRADDEALRSRVDTIHGVTLEILREAEELAESPLYTARRRAERILEAGRERRRTEENER